MIGPAALASAFDRNAQIVQMECKDLTHAESLLQPSFQANCMNWVIGHMLAGRNDVLQALNAPFLVDDAALAPYKRESAPITGDGDGVVPLEQLLEWLNEGQRHISELLSALTEEDAIREVQSVVTGRTTQLGKLAFFQYFHDSYHVGQTSLLRQLAGKNDKII